MTVFLVYVQKVTSAQLKQKNQFHVQKEPTIPTRNQKVMPIVQFAQLVLSAKFGAPTIGQGIPVQPATTVLTLTSEHLSWAHLDHAHQAHIAIKLVQLMKTSVGLALKATSAMKVLTIHSLVMRATTVLKKQPSN